MDFSPKHAQTPTSGERGLSLKGLSEKEAEKRLKKHGQNTFAQGKKVHPAHIFLSQFKDILIIILIVSTLLSVMMGEITEAIAILAIIIINAVMGFVQEYRTEKTLDALKNMAAPSAKVMRDGIQKNIPAAELVPDDLILLEAGDRVPADARIAEAYDLQVDESLLTGESLAVEKRALPGVGGDKPAGAVYMGTMVTRGKARAITYATGMSTQMGKIAGMLTDIEDEQTPLQKRLTQLGKYIAIGCLLICLVVTVTGILRGEPVLNMIITGISLAVAAVPEGLPAIVTIALALGVGRMLKRNALVRKLTAVETLGCANVVCSDKTGTLTENKMTVRQIVTLDHTIDVTGGGFETAGDFLIGGKKVNVDYLPDLAEVLEIGVLCNNAELYSEKPESSKLSFFSKNKTVGVNGDPTEGSLLIAASKAGISREKAMRQSPRLDELPFDSDRKCMSVVISTLHGKKLLVKGAPDVILKKCTRASSRGGNLLLSSTLRARILQANDQMADGALRVLAFACRDLNGGESSATLESNLTFIGLMGMIDPPRKEAFHAVTKCIRAGIKPVMITGDHKNTAAAIARELGILRGKSGILTGEELDRISDAELAKQAPHISVYARVSPAHKLRIVRAYKKNGSIVAMTGDGVNDAPAVKEADIGVSMGKTGTDVTKEASSIILLDDNFASIVAAIEEGRVIYQNIRKFIRYLLSCNIGEVLTMFVGILMGLPVVLLPIQILMVNLVTDGLPAIALGLEPPEKDVMDLKPRGAKESVFSNGLAGTMIFRGCLIGLSTLGAFVSVLKYSNSIETARSAAFLTLVLVQLVHVFECKSETKHLFRIPVLNNKWLIFSCLLSAALTLAAVYIPMLQPIFKTMPVSFRELIWILGYTMIGPLLSVFFVKSRKRAREGRKLTND